MANPVLSKKDFVERYIQGEFGNHSPTWRSAVEFKQESDSLGLYHIRNRVAGGKTWYNLTKNYCLIVWRRLLIHGYRLGDLYISQMAPTSSTLFQGEVARGIYGLDLIYSTQTLPMREALRIDSNYATGIRSLILLRHYLCQRSYDWLMYLLDTYEDHVVEFSVYAQDWGTVPGYNTVFWEVRKY